MSHRYKVVKQEKDALDSVIEKDGITHQFTMRDLLDAIEYAERTIKELDAKLRVERAIMVNIERHHPSVLNMPPEELATAHMYAEAKTLVAQIEPKLREFERALEADSKERDLLVKKFGIVKVEHKKAPADAEAS